MLQVINVDIFYADLQALLNSDSIKDAYLGIKVSEQSGSERRVAER